MAEPAKLITCVLPKGIAVKTLQAVRNEFDIQACNINNARGVGRITRLQDRGIGGQSEKEILNIIADADRADAIFEFVFHAANIDHPHGGMMYMAPLSAATMFLLPEISDED